MRRLLFLTWSMALVLAPVAAAQSTGAPAPAARKNLTVWDGLYSTGQAARGRAAYMKGCAECHSADLRGHEYAGALAGFGFQLKWADASIAELFGRMRSMPLGRPGSLERQEYLDILAYVLEQNGYPSGATDLTMEVAAQRWPRILIERQKQ
jgi:mono/diheme cytochrome c family protein